MLGGGVMNSGSQGCVDDPDLFEHRLDRTPFGAFNPRRMAIH
jgi:hypothetical protein